MNINIRVIILATFVAAMLLLLMLRTCSAPPKKGAVVYDTHCASCHGKQGEGFRNLIPPLTDSTWLAQNHEEFACIIAYGISREIVVNGTTYESPMHGIHTLNNVEIANVGNFIYQKWSNPRIKFTPETVEKAISNCE